jgi:NADH-quinone oxidoreductase subunit N
MTLAMVSLEAFRHSRVFRKIPTNQSGLEQAPGQPAYYWLVAIAIAGIVISLYYYFGVIRVIFWAKEAPDLSPIRPSGAMRFCVAVCVVGMFFLGLYPAPLLAAADRAVQGLH